MNEKNRNFFIALYSKGWIFYCIALIPFGVGMMTSLYFTSVVGNAILLPIAIGLCISLVVIFLTVNFYFYAMNFRKIESSLAEIENAYAKNPVRFYELVEGLLTSNYFGSLWLKFFEDELYFERYGDRFAELLKTVNWGFVVLSDERRISLYKAVLAKYQKIGNSPDAVGEWVNLLRDAVASTKALMQDRRKQIRDGITEPLTLNDYFARKLFDYDTVILSTKDVEYNIKELMRDNKDGIPYEVLAYFWETKNKGMLFNLGRFSYEIRTIPREALPHRV